jgi:flagellar protein FliO/FliZ
MTVFALAGLVEPAGALGVPDTYGALRALLATGAVLGLVALLAWLVRRGTIVLPGRRGRGPVTVESAVPLGERRSLLIVSVEGRRLLLGLTPASVSLVTELSAGGASFEQAVERRLDGPAGGRA